MNNYTTLEDLVLAAKAGYAEKTPDGWRARRSLKKATHELFYPMHNANGQWKVVAIQVKQEVAS